jgi:hypothetical protein
MFNNFLLVYLSDLQSKLDGNQPEPVLPDAANIISEQNQVLKWSLYTFRLV